MLEFILGIPWGNILAVIFFAFVGIGVILGLVYLFVYFASREETWATTVPNGEIKFIVAGDTLVDTLVNVPGFHLENGNIVPNGWRLENGNYVPDASYIPGDEPVRVNEGWIAKILRKRFGIWWVSWLYPNTRIVSYPFLWDKEKEKEKDGVKIKVIDRRERDVNSIYWKWVYPVVAKDVELEGGIKITIFGNVVLQVLVPATPVFTLKGMWFLPVIEKIEGEMTEFARTFDFTKWQLLDKTLKDDVDPIASPTNPSPPVYPLNLSLSKAVLSVNGTHGNKELENTFGVIVTEFNYGSFELSEHDKKVEEATKAEDLAKRLGKATVAKATADADAKEQEARGKAAFVQKVGEAETERVRTLYSAVAEAHPEGARMFQVEAQAAGLRDWQGKVYAPGGAANVLVNAETSSPPQSSATPAQSTLVAAPTRAIPPPQPVRGGGGQKKKKQGT